MRVHLASNQDNHCPLGQCSRASNRHSCLTPRANAQTNAIPTQDWFKSNLISLSCIRSFSISIPRALVDVMTGRMSMVARERILDMSRHDDDSWEWSGQAMGLM